MEEEIKANLQKIETPKELAFRISELASDKKALDIKIIHVGKVLYLTDYFVILSANTDKQAKAIFDYLVDELAKIKIKAIGVEGQRDALWILVDFGDVIVHIFQKDIREFYQLERLWSDVETIDFEEVKG